ncbi:hypothetical protein FB451DRAFT_1529602 [Mycena latifolia]|nr:hypothetical protein FB451DRAFT_1529602 [Mycena latifolia]
MTDAAATVFGVQELCDQIIFRHVELDVYQLPNGFMLFAEPALAAATAALRRLSAILTASLHLLQHIRSLSVLGPSEILEPALSIGFPLLRRLRFNFVDVNRLGINAAVFHLTHDCLALPSIREVELVNLFIAVREMFPISPARIPCRAQIKRLKLLSSEPLEDWIISPLCPVDFSHLVEVEMRGGQNCMLLQVLSSARQSIERLRITGGEPSGVRATNYLICTDASPQSAYKVISSLKPDNCVETLVFLIEVYQWEGDGASESLLATDAFVANFSMPALRQVELLVQGPSNDDFGFQFDWRPEACLS